MVIPLVKYYTPNVSSYFGISKFWITFFTDIKKNFSILIFFLRSAYFTKISAGYKS